MEKVIITGGNGFVGSYLTRMLIEKGIEVNLIIRPSSDLSYLEDIIQKVHLYIHDNSLDSLIKFFQVTKADAVFHLASLYITEHKSSDVGNLIHSNVLFGCMVLEAMKESETKILINTGTSWQHYHTNEYNPVNLYAATKEAFEKLIKYYIEAENIRCITLKLFDTYGENDKRKKLYFLLDKIAKSGESLDMSEGEQEIDLVHIDDVCEAFFNAYQELVSTPNIKEKSYGVSSNNIRTLKQVVRDYEVEHGVKLSINWGKRPYRKREVMKLWRSE